MFSQTVEYALRAMVYLAQHAPAQCTTDQIAQEMQVPKAYLAKVMQLLVRAGLVQSQRGLGGGMTLARPPAEVNLYEAVQAVDPIQRIKSCPLGLKEHAEHLCPLHSRLDEALASIENAFRATTLDQLLETDSPGASLTHSIKNARANSQKSDKRLLKAPEASDIQKAASPARASVAGPTGALREQPRTRTRRTTKRS